MTRLFCLSLVVALASDFPIQAQPRDPPKNFTNSLGMKFVWIPAGNFMMGSPTEEKEGDANDETPQHKVTLTKGFYMSIHPVTQEQWQAVMGNNPSHFKGQKHLPVETVSWGDCQEFIKKLREKDKKPYRLPTEAEWEYACRAGTTTPFHFGETISTDLANYNGTVTYGNGKEGKYRQKTTPVGNFPANAWGLHDMHGNVWQWCQDWLGDYPQKDVVDPQGPDAGGKGRVLRGGSWGSNPRLCRSAFRGGNGPEGRGDTFGFRLCFCLD
jgi:formylglycine-generating enzyme required for sulfatase activity